MFQPLLDAYTDSAYSDASDHKPPLNIAIANGWGGTKGFEASVLYFILSWRYKIALHENPNKPADLVFSNPLGQARKILSY